jgi:hypothetical protein
MRVLAAFFFMLFALPQQKSEPIFLHVKEVHRENEDTPQGNWTHFYVTAESKTVIYSLKCSELINTEKQTYTVLCSHVSAGTDYQAKKFPTAISFWLDSETTPSGTIRAAYEIMSEKEK